MHNRTLWINCVQPGQRFADSPVGYSQFIKPIGHNRHLHTLFTHQTGFYSPLFSAPKKAFLLKLVVAFSPSSTGPINTTTNYIKGVLL